MCAKSKKEVTYIKLLRPIELKTNFFEKKSRIINKISKYSVDIQFSHKFYKFTQKYARLSNSLE